MSTTVAIPEANVTASRKLYNFSYTQQQIDKLYDDIVNLKHALNVFYATKVLPEVGCTIDLAIERVRVLKEKRCRLASMRHIEAVKQNIDFQSQQVYNVYRNYDVREVEEEYRETEKKLNDLEIAIRTADVCENLDVPLTDGSSWGCNGFDGERLA